MPAETTFITLISDMGYADYYTGIIKGSLYSQLPNARLIDLTHRMTLHDGIVPAAFVLRNSYHMFPPNTIHMLAVDTNLHFNCRHVVFKHLGHYFIGTDNGAFSITFDDEPNEVYDISHHQGADGTFPALEVFVPAIIRIAKGEAPSDIGLPLTDGLTKKVMPHPTLDPNYIIGAVIYSDYYGNAITNITEEMFNRVSQGRKPNITIRPMGYPIKKLGKNYLDVDTGDLVALFNQAGYLEIAMNGGSLLKFVKAEVGVQIRIEFKSI